MERACGYADVLVGLQYGDEGKAKVVDLLANEYDVIARFNGGANAGHTVVTHRGMVKLRQIPSAVFYPDKVLYIGSGCAVGIVQLADEIKMLLDQGLSLEGRLFISGQCAVVQPSQMYQDKVHGQEIGTTGNGIGPCYADRALRMQDGKRVSLQIRDLLTDSESAIHLMQYRLEKLDSDNSLNGHFKTARRDMAEFARAWAVVKTYVVRDPLFLVKRVKDGARVLFEGAQSVLLDVMYGDQPYVTSSHTSPSYAFVGGDLPCHYHRKTIGVAKAIVSRVGSGPFPSELGGERSAKYCENAALIGSGRTIEFEKFDPQQLLKSGADFDLGIAIRMLTAEYGTGSGRPRRIGLLDLAQLSDAIALHGIDEIFLNKCDCLQYFAKTPLGGIPLLVSRKDATATVYFDSFALEGSSLPMELIKILQFIEQEIGCRIRGIGTGPGRDQSIIFNKTT